MRAVRQDKGNQMNDGDSPRPLLPASPTSATRTCSWGGKPPFVAPDTGYHVSSVALHRNPERNSPLLRLHVCRTDEPWVAAEVTSVPSDSQRRPRIVKRRKAPRFSAPKRSMQSSGQYVASNCLNHSSSNEHVPFAVGTPERINSLLGFVTDDRSDRTRPSIPAYPNLASPIRNECGLLTQMCTRLLMFASWKSLVLVQETPTRSRVNFCLWHFSLRQ